MEEDLRVLEKCGDDRQRIMVLALNAATVPGSATIRRNLKRHSATCAGLAVEIRAIVEQIYQTLADRTLGSNGMHGGIRGEVRKLAREKRGRPLTLANGCTGTE